MFIPPALNNSKLLVAFDMYLYSTSLLHSFLTIEGSYFIHSGVEPQPRIGVNACIMAILRRYWYTPYELFYHITSPSIEYQMAVHSRCFSLIHERILTFYFSRSHCIIIPCAPVICYVSVPVAYLSTQAISAEQPSQITSFLEISC